MVINRALLRTIIHLNEMSVHGSADLNDGMEKNLLTVELLIVRGASCFINTTSNQVTASHVRVKNLDLIVTEFVPGIH